VLSKQNYYNCIRPFPLCNRAETKESPVFSLPAGQVAAMEHNDPHLPRLFQQMLHRHLPKSGARLSGAIRLPSKPPSIMSAHLILAPMSLNLALYLKLIPHMCSRQPYFPFELSSRCPFVVLLSHCVACNCPRPWAPARASCQRSAASEATPPPG
jgi:hypothetical protein